VDRYRVAVIPGDGIGADVIAGGLAVLRQAGEVTGSFALDTTEYPWSCQWYLEHGGMMPKDGLDQLRGSDAIYLGAIGFPGVPDHISLRGLLLPIRFAFDQYVNLRPIELLDGIPGPLRDRGPADIDILCVRENTEGEYAGLGGRFHEGRPDETAVQTSVFTRKGIERVAHFAFDQARLRRRKVASATKSNALQYSAVFWDEVVAEVGTEYPDVELTKYHVDALAARFVTSPQSLDVVVGSNLFGDILTDIGGALQGSLGLPAGANLNPERRYPSMFEPIHGSAPDIAGRGIANPMAAVWAGALMLEHLGQPEGASLVMTALRRIAKQGPRTPDLGGTASTSDLVGALTEAVRQCAGPASGSGQTPMLQP
jgi:tartrate dehydrogenase/decarboxylase/D-malate dehydrogenase